MTPKTRAERKQSDRVKPRGSAQKMVSEEESVRDIRDCLVELQRAKLEIAAVDVALPKSEKKRALVEPLGRMALVKRFIESVLHRHGWKPAR